MNEQAQALRESIDTAAAALLEELKQGKSERLMAVLAFSARFHRYSMGNQWLIAMQCPNATRVAGYKTWERMGYHVAKGQRGIRILAPRPYVRKGEDGEPDRAGMYFTSVAVFDASQLVPEELEARPLPEFFYALGSDEQSDALYARMVSAMREAGIRVEDSDTLRPGVQGTSSGGVVRLRSDLPSRNRVKTLAHEWAHELLHQGDGEAKGVKYNLGECHAEAVSYIVCAHFGIHNPFSSDYIQNWGNTAETLLGELGLVQKAAAHIIAALEPQEGEAE